MKDTKRQKIDTRKGFVCYWSCAKLGISQFTLKSRQHTYRVYTGDPYFHWVSLDIPCKAEGLECSYSSCFKTGNIEKEYSKFLVKHISFSNVFKVDSFKKINHTCFKNLFKVFLLDFIFVKDSKIQLSIGISCKSKEKNEHSLQIYCKLMQRQEHIIVTCARFLTFH